MAGFTPIDEPLILTRGADFVHRFEIGPTDEPFPEGTQARIVITKTAASDAPVLATLTADDISGAAIEFWSQSEQVDPIAAPARYRLLVTYPPLPPETRSLDFCWYRGPVQREQ